VPAQRVCVDARAHLFPPLWRKVMDHRVVAHYEATSAGQLHPRMRDKVLAKYGPKRDRLQVPGCDYVYDEAKGAPREGFRQGPVDDVPDDWCCPECAVREKIDFDEMG